MRVAFIRTDLAHQYLDDVENSSQRNFSSEPAGQSRYFHKPTTAELQAVLDAHALVTIRGSDTGATVNTTVANGTLLNIKASASAAAYTQVTVTSGAAVTKAQIVADLNSQFAAAGLALNARISGTNQVTIDTTQGGQNAYISLSATSPSAAALQTVLGLTVATTTGITTTTLSAAVYPSATTADVSAATINALGTFALMTAAQQSALDTGVADSVAPALIETGPVLLSFAYGKLSKLRAATFQPGSPNTATEARIGLPAGAAVYVLANDGTTPFVI